MMLMASSTVSASMTYKAGPNSSVLSVSYALTRPLHAFASHTRTHVYPTFLRPPRSTVGPTQLPFARPLTSAFRPSSKISAPSSTDLVMSPVILSLAAGEMTGPLLVSFYLEESETDVHIGRRVESTSDLELGRPLDELGHPVFRLAHHNHCDEPGYDRQGGLYSHTESAMHR